MYLGSSSTNLLPGRGLINPAFVIKVVPATDNLQQQVSTGRDNPENDYLDNLHNGDQVKCKIKNKTIIGKVLRVIKNTEGDGIFVEVMDSRGKTHKVNGSNIVRAKRPSVDDDKARLVSSPSLFGESRILSFDEFFSL